MEIIGSGQKVILPDLSYMFVNVGNLFLSVLQMKVVHCINSVFLIPKKIRGFQGFSGYSLRKLF